MDPWKKKAPRALHSMAWLLVLIFVLLQTACSFSTSSEGLDRKAHQVVVSLPITDGTIHVLCDDIDGDGDSDLAFTSHGGSFTQVFFQTGPRVFCPGPRDSIVGFHPNDLVRIPGPERLYLMNAEGAHRLLVLRPGPDGGFDLVSETSQPQARSTAVFSWPDWGMSLIVSPYGGDSLTLFRDFEPLKAQAETVYTVTPEAGHQIPGYCSVADIDGDGIDELLFTTRRTNEVWLIRYPRADEGPKAELLRRFDRGNARQVVPFDVNNDGKIDLLVPQQTGKEISILINKGAGDFVLGDALAFPYDPGPSHISAAVDRDGSRYVVAGAYKGFVLYRVVADGESGVEMLSFPVAVWPTFTVLEDIDGDGWLDVVAAMKSSKRSSMLIYGPLWDSVKRQVESGDIF
jgi:hypothetical protein